MFNFSFTTIIISFLISTSAQARCEQVARESFSGEFKILNIEKVSLPCHFDEKGMSVAGTPVRIEQTGCIIEIEVLKVSKGKSPKENAPRNGRYSVYAANDLCNAKIGSTIARSLESNATECCRERERARKNKMDNCQMLPEPKLFSIPTEAFLKCNNIENGWAIVESK